MSSYKEVFENNLFNWCEFEAKNYSNDGAEFLIQLPIVY